MVSNADEAGASAALSVEQARFDAKYTDCAELHHIAARAGAKINSENFPVALRLLPKAARDQLVLAYAFARFVDDVGDEASGDRLGLLAAIDADIDELEHGRAQLPPVRDLAALVAGGAIDTQPLHDLVAANRHDQVSTTCETFDDLMDYCRLSAAPVGRMVLSIAGVSDAAAIERSDRVCAALQIYEHCQDVAEDFAAGRVYLPAAELRAAGVDVAELGAHATSAGLRRVIAQQVERGDELLAAGSPLVRQLHGWARVAVLGYVAGGRATSAALRGARYDVLSLAVRPSRLMTVGHALRLATGRAR